MHLPPCRFGHANRPGRIIRSSDGMAQERIGLRPRQGVVETCDGQCPQWCRIRANRARMRIPPRDERGLACRVSGAPQSSYWDSMALVVRSRTWRIADLSRRAFAMRSPLGFLVTDPMDLAGGVVLDMVCRGLCARAVASRPQGRSAGCTQAGAPSNPRGRPAIAIQTAMCWLGTRPSRVGLA